MKPIFFLLLGSTAFFSSCESRPGAESTTQEPDTTITESPQQAPRLEQAWATEAVLETPESVFYNPDDNTLYVSNIVGDARQKDGKGYISKLSLEGEIVEKEWASGIDAPKGMAMMDGILYVTNIDELVAIDKSGKITRRYPVKGAKFLNDPVEADGKILFTDMEEAKIWALQDGKISLWKEGGMKNPNGLAYRDGQVYLASGNLEKISRDGDSEVLAREIGFGDGIGIVDENTFLVSNWQGEIWYVQRGQEKIKLLDTKDQKINSADITYIPEHNLLLVPTFNDNRVVAYRLQR
jgi:outer membrane protein assembly factor BamB